MAPTETSNGILTIQGFADSVIVAVKPNTSENMVTYLRIKYSEKIKDDKAFVYFGRRGLNMIIRSEANKTISSRSEKKTLCNKVDVTTGRHKDDRD